MTRHFRPLKDLKSKETASLDDRIDRDNDYALSDTLPEYEKEFKMLRYDWMAKRGKKKDFMKWFDSFIMTFAKDYKTGVQVISDRWKWDKTNRLFALEGFGGPDKKRYQRYIMSFITTGFEFGDQKIQGYLQIDGSNNLVKIQLRPSFKEYTNGDIKDFKRLTDGLERLGKNYGKYKNSRNEAKELKKLEKKMENVMKEYGKK